MSKSSKSETKTTNEPWKQAQPYVLGAANNAQQAYNQAMPGVNAASGLTNELLPDLARQMAEKYTAGNPNLNAAGAYNTSVLSGKYLNSNPYLNQVLKASNNDVMNSSQAALGLRGLTGGSSYADIISRNVGENSANMRMQNYNNERQLQQQAAGQAPGLAAADVIQIAPLLATLQANSGAAMDPLQASAMYSGQIGGLMSPYSSSNSQTTQTGPSPLWGLMGAGLGGWASGGFG